MGGGPGRRAVSVTAADSAGSLCCAAYCLARDKAERQTAEAEEGAAGSRFGSIILGAGLIDDVVAVCAVAAIAFATGVHLGAYNAVALLAVDALYS